MNPRILSVLAIAAIVATRAPQASAQTTGQQQGSTGLFVGSNSDASARQTLDLTLSSTQGYDSDLGPEAGTAGLGGPESTGYSTLLVGGGEYAWQIRRVQLRATGTSTMRYLRPLDNLYASTRSLSYTAGVGFLARLPKRTSLLVNQTATFSPSYLYNLFPQAPSSAPGDAPPATPDYTVSGFESRTYGTATTLTHDFTARSSVLTIADYQTTETLGGTDVRPSLGSYGIRGRFSHHFGRNIATLAEYLYRNSEFQAVPGLTTVGTAVEHGVNVGFDYNRRLSASRQLNFGALVGSSITILPDPSTLVSPDPSITPAPDPSIAIVTESIAGAEMNNRYYRRMSGQATIAYDFARMWKVSAIYRRGVDYIAGFRAPVAADRFSTSVSGLLSRRVDILASAGYSNGESALYLAGPSFNTYTGDVRLRYALTRKFAAYVEYLYYFYDSRGGMLIAPGIPSGLERKGVRAGLTLRVPAVRR